VLKRVENILTFKRDCKITFQNLNLLPGTLNNSIGFIYNYLIILFLFLIMYICIQSNSKIKFF
jgi:hypothetical protein